MKMHLNQSKDNSAVPDKTEEIKMEEKSEVVTNEDGERIVPASKITKVTRNLHVVLADGSSYPGQAALNYENNDLWVWIEPKEGLDMVTLFPIFSNPEKTSRIESWILDEKEPTVFEGYTKMNVIKADRKGTISIRLLHE